MVFSATFIILLAISASVEPLALPERRQFSDPLDDNPTSFVDVSALSIGEVDPVSSEPHSDFFRHDDVEFIAPVVLDDVFPKEDGDDAFISTSVEEDFNFPKLLHSGEHFDTSLSRNEAPSFDAKVYPTIYYPESDISSVNNIAPDYHVKEYPENYRQVKEYSDPKHHVATNPLEKHEALAPADQSGTASGFAVHELKTSHRFPDVKFHESEKGTADIFGAEKAIAEVQDPLKSHEVFFVGKNRPGQGNSHPKTAHDVARQFDSSDFFDFDYSSSSGSSDPFEGNYDGDYYAPGDDDTTVHVGNDAAYDYDYSNSHGPDLSSGFSSFTDTFARSSSTSFGKTKLP